MLTGSLSLTVKVGALLVLIAAGALLAGPPKRERDDYNSRAPLVSAIVSTLRT